MHGIEFTFYLVMQGTDSKYIIMNFRTILFDLSPVTPKVCKRFLLANIIELFVKY